MHDNVRGKQRFLLRFKSAEAAAVAYTGFRGSSNAAQAVLTLKHTALQNSLVSLAMYLQHTARASCGFGEELVVLARGSGIQVKLGVGELIPYPFHIQLQTGRLLDPGEPFLRASSAKVARQLCKLLDKPPPLPGGWQQQQQRRWQQQQQQQQGGQQEQQQQTREQQQQRQQPREQQQQQQQQQQQPQQPGEQQQQRQIPRKQQQQQQQQQQQEQPQQEQKQQELQRRRLKALMPTKRKATGTPRTQDHGDLSRSENLPEHACGLARKCASALVAGWLK